MDLLRGFAHRIQMTEEILRLDEALILSLEDQIRLMRHNLGLKDLMIAMQERHKNQHDQSTALTQQTITLRLNYIQNYNSHKKTMEELVLKRDSLKRSAAEKLSEEGDSSKKIKIESVEEEDRDQQSSSSASPRPTSSNQSEESSSQTDNQ